MGRRRSVPGRRLRAAGLIPFARGAGLPGGLDPTDRTSGWMRPLFRWSNSPRRLSGPTNIPAAKGSGVTVFQFEGRAEFVLDERHRQVASGPLDDAADGVGGPAQACR